MICAPANETAQISAGAQLVIVNVPNGRKISDHVRTAESYTEGAFLYEPPVSLATDRLNVAVLARMDRMERREDRNLQNRCALGSHGATNLNSASSVTV